jgi:hypothetical protein
VFQEGDWFLVPLLSGGYSAGRIARIGTSHIYCFFFGERFREIPDLDRFLGYTKDRAVLEGITLDVALTREQWPLLGPYGPWQRGEWTMPRLFQGLDRLIVLDPDNPSVELSNVYGGDSLQIGTYPAPGSMHPRGVEWELDYLVPRTNTYPHVSGDVYLVKHYRKEVWFACVVFGANDQGELKASFFGPWPETPHAAALTRLSQTDALFTGMIRDSAILDGSWQKAGSIADFDPTEWQLPTFKTWNRAQRRFYKTWYNQQDPMLPPIISPDPIPPEETDHYPDYARYDGWRIGLEFDEVLASWQKQNRSKF